MQHDEIKSERSPVIRRFHISGEKGYSEFWRRNKSPIQTIELARILTALRKSAVFWMLNTRRSQTECGRLISIISCCRK
ncbi:MAG: hypothetical protein BWK80_43660 [Desulfobacteraceae bacterium IS3]|nr:MAG: hypothetical protein BWK80_43660 [Desulfobacteraceae bacterium IS3]